jgi:hypothetical protein
MGTSVSLKNSRQLLPVFLALVLGLIALPGTAGIVLQSGAVVGAIPSVPFNQGMPTIVMAPYGLATSQASYPLQRSLAWSAYRRQDSATGLPLIYSGAMGASTGAMSPRQANVRAHLAKASAYRLGYMGK